jgi:uncharacterized DUF497 family protein
MQFEWDQSKEAANRRKHDVEFREAATVFGDPLAATFPDPDHSAYEQRFLTIGVSARRRMLLLAHIESGDKVRIICAAPRYAPREKIL